MHLAALIGRRAIVASASVVTVLTVLSLDIAAGTGPTHTVGLVALAVIVSATRITLAGRHRGLFATLSAALVAQPAVHALGEGLDPAAAHSHTATTGLEHTVTASVATATHLLLAGLVILGVGTAEWILELVTLTVGRALTLLMLVLRGASRRHIAGPTIPAAPRPMRVGGIWIDYAARRGPPRRTLSVPA